MLAVKENVIFLLTVYLMHLDFLHAVQWEVKTYPNPQTDLRDCGRQGKQSFVCDPDGILSYSEGN